MPGLDIRWWISPWGATSSENEDMRPVCSASIVHFSSSEQMSSISYLDASYEWNVFVSCQSLTGSNLGSESSEDIQITRADRPEVRV